MCYNGAPMTPTFILESAPPSWYTWSRRDIAIATLALVTLAAIATIVVPISFTATLIAATLLETLFFLRLYTQRHGSTPLEKYVVSMMSLGVSPNDIANIQNPDLAAFLIVILYIQRDFDTAKSLYNWFEQNGFTEFRSRIPKGIVHYLTHQNPWDFDNLEVLKILVTHAPIEELTQQIPDLLQQALKGYTEDLIPPGYREVAIAIAVRARDSSHPPKEFLQSILKHTKTLQENQRLSWNSWKQWTLVPPTQFFTISREIPNKNLICWQLVIALIEKDWDNAKKLFQENPPPNIMGFIPWGVALLESYSEDPNLPETLTSIIQQYLSTLPRGFSPAEISAIPYLAPFYNNSLPSLGQLRELLANDLGIWDLPDFSERFLKRTFSEDPRNEAPCLLWRNIFSRMADIPPEALPEIMHFVITHWDRISNAPPSED